MGILQDLFDLLRDLKEISAREDEESLKRLIPVNVRRNSIARKAGDAILQFPVLTSDAISVDDLTMVNKALEREYATFLRVAMGLDDYFDAERDNKITHLRKFHQNVGTRTTAYLSRDVLESQMLAANAAALKPYSEGMGLRTDTLNEKTSRNNLNHYAVGRGTPPRGFRKTLSEDPRNVINIGADRSNYTNELLPADVKKANELVPTMLDISVFTATKSGTFQTHILLGVKTVTHLIPSEQMTYNIAKAIEDKRSLFRFIQWTTGEIRFLKDYVLMMDRARKEAIDANRGSKWWKTLRRRAASEKLRRFVPFAKNQMLPNATLLITMDEAEYILNNYNIDLIRNTRAIEQMMDTLFLLGFVIVDPGAQIAYFFFDGQSSYQTYSYSALERENTQNTDVKALVQLMRK